MSKRERERKGKKKKKEFDVRSAHPARGTRDAMYSRAKGKGDRTIEFDRNWLVEKLDQISVLLKKKKKEKAGKAVKFSVKGKKEYYEGIIFGKISHAIILSKESVSGGEFVYRLEPFSLGRAADTIKTLSTSCATRLRARSSYYVSDTRISRTNQPAKANQKGIRSSSLTIN